MNKIDYYTKFGLHLPFRFYDSRTKISETSDWGIKTAIPKTEYLLMPHSIILPFQIVRPFGISTTYTFEIICVEDDSVYVDLSSIVAGYFVTTTIGTVDYITFLGIDKQDIPTGGYYAHFSDGTNDYYSENFTIFEYDGLSDIFRSYGEGLRLVEDSILRIV